ncbi:MAG: Lrp/AsnC family transcriptional regulator [Christensenellales bacterium]|jgi:DNA-binding Lrp family transcriptional regulator|nr:Lrp/AsnC family transcriptional regulator [Christensenellaceae bacterium]
MNNLSHKVLDILKADCRTPLEDISVMLGEDSVKIAAEIDKLQKDGVILKYMPVINWDKTDRQFVEAIIEVKVTPQKEEGFDTIAKNIYQYEEVRSVFLVSGMYDLLILAEAPTLKELALFVSEKLSVIDFVTATSTSFILKRYKQDGVIFEIPTRDRRLLVSP